jgi:multidrug efflux pump subunit AcrA (membrane-fusion protein)
MKCAVVAAIAACASPATETKEPSIPPPRRELTAIIASRDVSMVAAEVEGRVKLQIGIGDRVRAGAVIAELDAAELRANLAIAKFDETAAQGEVFATSTELAQGRRVLAMDERLASHGFGSTDSVKDDSAGVTRLQGRMQIANARYSAAKTRRIELERQVAATTIKAPSNGVITQLKVKTGEIVGKGSPIAQISDPERLALRFAVPPDMPVGIGRRVEATLAKNVQLRGTVRTFPDTLALDHFIIVDADLDDPRRATLGATGKLWLLDD